MSAMGFAIIIFIVVFAIVIVGAVVFLRFYRAKGPLKVDRSLSVPGGETKKSPREPKQQSSGDAQRSLSTRRLNIFSAVVAAVLGVLGIKAWSLQVIGGSEYASEAEGNMTAKVSVPANRGRILDRKGRELVTNRASRTVVCDSSVIDNRKVVQRLSLVLGLPKAAIRARLMDETSGAQSDRIVATDVSMRAVSYIEENPTVFPGVSVETRTLRYYPYGALACHMLGYSGTISEEELAAETEGIVYESGDIVGKTGVEAAYERVLQGTRGERTYRVNSNGDPIAIIDEIEANPGNDIKITIDLDVQQAADAALQEAFINAQDRGKKNAKRGSIVVLDIKTGGVIASASAPTFNPNDFVGGISNDLWTSLNSEESGYPMTNRTLAGQYPAASTYKAFTGLAGLTYNLVDNKIKYDCKGTWTGMGDRYPKKCWLLTGHGELDIYYAIAHSCDVYFYEIASSLWSIRESQPDALQEYLRSWGFGSVTGIDIGGEGEGRVPDEEWKVAYFWETPEDAQWVPGDLANMIIGQGDVLVTPMQMAVGYSGIASGTMFAPHLLYQVLNRDGQVVIPETVTPSAFTPQFTDENIKIIRDALRLVVTEGGATSVFEGFPINMAGKSGTGETGSEERDDYAWFIAYGPIEDPQYCCVCVIEQGGGGTAIAGPPVRRVMASVFGVDEDGIVYAEDTGER